MTQNELMFRDLGKAYAQGALEHLMAKVGGSEISLSQLLAYQAAAVSWLAASGFGLAIEKAGMDEAERFLSLIMTGIPACIRLKGAPVLVSFQAKMEPVEEELPKVQAQTQLVQPPVCSCQLVDGECASCPSALEEKYVELSFNLACHLKEMEEMTGSLAKSCVPCGAKYADAVIAKIVRNGISPALAQEPEPLRQQAVAIALQTVQAFNLTDAPLTVAALRERQAQGQAQAQAQAQG